MLLQLDRLSLEKIVIVLGYESEKLRSFIDSLPVKTNIEYVTNSDYDKTNNIYSLYLAKNYLINDDTLLLESDLFIEDSVLPKLFGNPYPDLALVARFESWMDGTVVTLDANNNILRFIPKKYFSFDEISGYFKTVNIYKFSREFSSTHYVPFLEAYMKSFGCNDYYEQVLGVITFMGASGLKALPLENEKWYEIDTVEDLDIAESIFADESERFKKLEYQNGGFWRYPGLLDFSHSVNPFFPGERLLSELRTISINLIKENPSNPNVLKFLASKYFNIKPEYICVGSGTCELLNELLGNIKSRIGVVFPCSEEYLHCGFKNEIDIFIPSSDDPTYKGSDLISFFSDKSISHLMILNPDNYSGNFLPYSDLLLLADWADKRGIILIIDESYSCFSEQSIDNKSLIDNQILEHNPHLTVIKSFSHSNGIPGLCISIIASGNKVLIDELFRKITIWHISSFAEYYMQIIGKYESEFNASCKKMVEERERFYNDLQNIEFLVVFPSHASFFLCKVLPPLSANKLCITLLKEFDILIKRVKNEEDGYSENEFVIIAIRNKKDNERIVEACKKILLG
jgi:histidinol-phosphate/aromatic aminotransferase/cobyric acid decarboxylase-like protein/choline kinase